ncbi:hypothetical protein ILYODFUR_032778, partial [Ilyodon furcidens]
FLAPNSPGNPDFSNEARTLLSSYYKESWDRDDRQHLRHHLEKWIHSILPRWPTNNP